MSLTPEQVYQLINDPDIVATIEANKINAAPLAQTKRESDLIRSKSMPLQITISTHSDFWGDEPTRDDVNGLKRVIRDVAREWGTQVEIETVPDDSYKNEQEAQNLVDEAWGRFCNQ